MSLWEDTQCRNGVFIFFVHLNVTFKNNQVLSKLKYMQNSSNLSKTYTDADMLLLSRLSQVIVVC